MFRSATGLGGTRFLRFMRLASAGRIGHAGLAMAGATALINTNNMYESTRLTDDQKRAFAEMVRDAQKRFESDFDGYLSSLKHDLTPKIEARARVRGLMDSVRVLKSKLSEAANGLRKLGFHVDEGMISVDYDNRSDVRRELEEVQRSALEEREKSMAKFRKAMFEIWSAENADEAKKIVEAVL